MTLRTIITKAGAEYLGIKGDLVYFNDPMTGSTLGISADKITMKSVKRKLEESRKDFKKKEVKEK